MYKSLGDCINDLERHGFLLRINREVDPDLEMAAIHRRVFKAGGPALFFEKVKGSPFPAVSNLFGTEDRLRFIFRHTLKKVEDLIRLKINPVTGLKSFHRLAHLPLTGKNALPKKINKISGFFNETKIDRLPMIKCWPKDGGAFITLPQVLSIDPEYKDIHHSNLGMYRIQLSGNQYKLNDETGLHYQIHRGIGVHHTKAITLKKELKISIFIGGPPAHTLAAIMPLPENLSELSFAGALAGRRFRYQPFNGYYLSTDADFCITGRIDASRLLPEGPFGDHLGYYSMTHDFPVLKIDKVFYKKEAVWPFTVVGRPPQEDSVIGKFIHDLTRELIPFEIPGIKAVHAVDAAGVHPLLLAIGRERYTPYSSEREPMELLTQANAILGYGQLSLAKYLFIATDEDDPDLDIQKPESFFMHILSRVNWKKDIHFQTNTTIDTLDYSGTKLNRGSKAIIAAAGNPIRKLAFKDSDINWNLKGLDKSLILPGLLAIEFSSFNSYSSAKQEILKFSLLLAGKKHDQIAMIVLVDDLMFVKASLNNFLWVTFTRSNPSHDIYGVNEFIENKHWGCKGPLIIDARIKPHHAPPLEEDPSVEKNVDRLGAKGGPLHGII
ncbi:MAG: UbiD family decarboxylase [Calditrichaceae bacterium]|nr:UbiD family decarboxylase [Calditrichaceae bacterium]MBN2710753.1 UbiD family decarboxylase [Calditrichaceae bacterium]RQV95719.1 MAG: UbiD family decarboxylase [Calditrichota bacterium]